MAKSILTSAAFMANPHPVLQDLVARGPITQSKIPFLGKMNFLTHHNAVMEMLKSSDRFVVDGRNAGKRSQIPIPYMPKTFKLLMSNMLSLDDPDHRRLRKIADKTFRTANIEALRPAIAAMADALLDKMEAKGETDLMQGYFDVLPLLVICELLGLEAEDRDRLTDEIRSFADISSVLGVFKISPAIKRMSNYLRAEFDEVRKNPKPGLISEFVKLADTDEDRLSENELLSMVFVLFIAGHETTKNLLSCAVPCLLNHPEQLNNLREDSALWPMAVEELIRFTSPVQMTKPRYVVRDMEFHGQKMRKGQMFMALLSAANIDPAYFEAPLSFNIHREKVRHVGFGNGVHLCLGIQLARVEAQIALERLFIRYPELSLAVPQDQLVWAKRLGSRGLKQLPIRFNAHE
ncbi:MAG: cytochrome P450 [Litorimonas sp.]